MFVWPVSVMVSLTLVCLYGYWITHEPKSIYGIIAIIQSYILYLFNLKDVIGGEKTVADIYFYNGNNILGLDYQHNLLLNLFDV